MSHPVTSPPLRPDPTRRESTNSAGTFGSRQRRWSALHSSPANISPPGSLSGTLEDAQSGSTPSHRRPLSMSSASDSTISGLAQIGTAERVHVGRSNISGSLFPSPTLKRPVHKSPESAAEINAHLLKASGKNETRIVPRSSSTKTAPSVGTPILSRVKEEDDRRRRTSKLDQILGEGAETARVLMEFDKRALREVVQMPGMSPPRHRSSASVPSSPSIPILPPSPPNRPFYPDDVRYTPLRSARIHYSPGHGRSDSVDSLPSSLHPSLTESTHTIARLLPAQPPTPSQPLPRLPTDKETATLATVQVHNDLTPEQRAVLIRRARKIEQMLGEPLGEQTVSQHVVGPSTASTMVHTSREDVVGDVLAGRIPEYERQDCQPRTIAADRPGVKSTSKMASKAMAALGLGADKREEEDLRVYVSREKTVSELRKENRNELPKSPTEDKWEDEEDVARRTRRLQVAKLNRILGVQIPASALQPAQLDSDTTGNAARRPATPVRAPSDLSYVSFDDDASPPSWSKRVRTAVNNAKERDKGLSFWDGALTGMKNSTPAKNQSFGNRDGMEGSFMDLGNTKKTGQVQRSSSMRDTSKLEKVLGNKPPPEAFPDTFFHTRPRSLSRPSHSSSISTVTPIKLAHLMDTIDNHPSSAQLYSSIVRREKDESDSDPTPLNGQSRLPNIYDTLGGKAMGVGLMADFFPSRRVR